MRYLSHEVVLERLEAIWTYEQDERRAGRGARFDAALTATFRRIQESPRGHARDTRYTRRVIRRAKVLKFPYSVVYFIHRGEPIIVAIAHQRLRPSYWASRLR